MLDWIDHKFNFFNVKLDLTLHKNHIKMRIKGFM